MTNKQIISKLKILLDSDDIDKDGLLNRKTSTEYKEINILLDHLSILIKDLKLNAEANRRELFQVRKLLEN